MTAGPAEGQVSSLLLCRLPDTNLQRHHRHAAAEHPFRHVALA